MFCCLQTSVREGVGQILALHDMPRGILLGHDAGYLVHELDTVIKMAFDKCPMAGPGAVNVPPGGGAAEGELVWRGPHHRTILFVQRQHMVWLATAKEHPCVQGIGPGRDGWSRETIKRMVDMIIDHFDHSEDENLLANVSVQYWRQDF